MGVVSNAFGWCWPADLDEQRLGPAAAQELRAERMRIVRSQALFCHGASLAHAALLAFVFWDRGIDGFLAVWMLALAAPILLVAPHLGASANPPSGSQRSVQRLARQAVAFAMLWGTGILVMRTVATVHDIAVLVTAIVGMMAAGTTALYSVPRAAIAWTLTLVTYAVVLFALFGAAGVVPILFCCVLVPVIVRNIGLQAAALTREVAVQRKLESEREITNDLLRHYENDAAERRWETDRDGLLIRAPQSLCDALGYDLLRPRRFIDVLGDCVAADAYDALSTLAERLTSQQAFNDLTLSIRSERDGSLLYICLRGRPTTDTHGVFAGYLGFAADQTVERTAADRATFLATHDALTNLANRVALSERLDAWTRAERPFALIAFDLDRFKLVNDTLGHPAGDQLLVEVARRLTEIAAPHDAFVCRAAGDEFFVLLPGEAGSVGRGALARQASRLASLMVEHLGQPYALRAGPAAVGSSAGTALFPFDATLPADLLSRADLALYAAKAGGRGIHRAWEPQMEVEASRKRCMESDLRNALEQGEMSLMFQPIHDMSKNGVVGMEALLRWSHPERGNVTPGEFLPTAEATGLIVPIGEWVLREACREAASWSEAMTVSVNVSAAQLASEGFVATVMAAVASAGLRPARLELDVTERALVDDSERTLGVIQHLRSFGIRVALDDFGTCYATMGAMHDALFDKIKIDGMFVGDLDDRAEGRGSALIAAILGLASEFQIPTTAECVETREQAQALARLGCATGQGYHFAHPMTPGEAAALAGGRRSGERGSRRSEPKLRVVGGTASLGARAKLAG